MSSCPEPDSCKQKGTKPITHHCSSFPHTALSAPLVRHDPSSVCASCAALPGSLIRPPALVLRLHWKCCEQNQQLLHGAEFAALRSQQRPQLHACGLPVSFPPPPPPHPSPNPHISQSHFLWQRTALVFSSGIANPESQSFPTASAPVVLTCPALPCPGLPLSVAGSPCWAFSKPDLNLNLGDLN